MSLETTLKKVPKLEIKIKKTENNDLITYNLQDVIPLLTCPLCSGYIVNAVAITECNHKFCKSCILKHFFSDSSNKTDCPVCGITAHSSMPWASLIEDTTWQSLTYLLIPNLFNTEQSNRKRFWSKKGFQFTSTEKPGRKWQKQTAAKNFHFEQEKEILQKFPPIKLVKKDQESPSKSNDSGLSTVSIYKQPKKKRKTDEINREDLTNWTWVQCEHSACNKWRRVPPNSIKNPDAPWFCDMNVLKEYNSCQDLEEDYKMYNKAMVESGVDIGYIYSELYEGAVVWGKVAGGAPKWPGVIVRHPDDQNYIEYDQGGDIFAYHIEFF